MKNYLKFEDAVTFAKALANTRRQGIKESLENGIYVEKLSLVLPVPLKENKADDKTVLVSYLSGGVNISADKDSTIRELMLDVSKEEYEEIFKAAEIDLTTTKTRTKTRKQYNYE